MEQLPYLQPKIFTIEHNNFNYEFVACHEYFSDDDDPAEPGAGIDFTGGYLLIMLTPSGTFQTVIDVHDEAPEDDIRGFDNELFKKVVAQLSR